MADPFVAEIRIFPFNFAPKGLGVVRRAVAAAVAEYGALLAAWNHVRRGWQVEFRLARPAGKCADAPRARTRFVIARSG